MKILLLLFILFILYIIIKSYINFFIIGLLALLYYYKPSLVYDFILLSYNTISNNKKKPKATKRNVTESTKKLVASNQQWKCIHCKNLLDATYEIDHCIPLYKGGTNEIDNLNAMCRNCHGKKTLIDKLTK